LTPRTYVAGLFDSAGGGAPIAALVPAAGWLALGVSSSASSPAIRDYKIDAHSLTLDMKRGLVIGQGLQKDPARTRGSVRTLHFVSLHTRALGVQLVEMRVDANDVVISLEMPLERGNLGLIEDESGSLVRTWHTENSGKRVGIGITASLSIAGGSHPPAASSERSTRWTWSSRTGEVVLFERIVAFVRGEDDDANIAARVREEIDGACELGWRELLDAHEAAWASRWYASDVAVTGDPAAQRALRFAIYHLNSACDPTDDGVSVGARGLTGEDYHGHVFWDTEIYLVPFYTLTWPEAARAPDVSVSHARRSRRESATPRLARGLVRMGVRR
jgi:trehalose/maltose hydrolase-like predicted phosphorylase